MASITMPSYPAFRASNFYLKRNTRIFESPLNRSVQRLILPGDRWEAVYQLPKMRRQDALAWVVFFNQLRGSVNTFPAYDPEGRTPQGSASGSPTVDGGSQTGYTLDTSNWPTSTTILRAGDYVSFGSELKMITSDIASDGSGNATLSFEPAIRTSPSNGSAVTYQNTTVEMIITDDDIGSWQTDYNGIYLEKTFRAQESFF